MKPQWRDVALFMGGAGSGLFALIPVPEDQWFMMVKNLGPLLYLGAIAIFLALVLIKD